MIRLLVAILFSVSLSVFAKDAPPVPLREHITSHPLVHQGTCTIGNMNKTPCMVFHDQKHDVLWVVLFDKQGYATHIIAVKNKEGTMVWIRSDHLT